MDVQELLNVIEGIKGNSLLGVIIALYYLLINWSKIINGLGLLKKNKIDLVKIEKNYELLKLRSNYSGL